MATKAKREVSSPEEVYSHSLLRYLSRRYAEAYVEPEDLLQEAALAVWEELERGITNPHFLFLAAKWAMLNYKHRGRSVDRARPTYNRKRPVRVQQFDDMRSQDEASPGPDPLETWAGKDERASQFPAVVALRDLIERIYAYEGYNDGQRLLLKMHRDGLASEEIQDHLGLSPDQYADRMRRLRTRILLDALDGRKLSAPDDVSLPQQQERVYKMYRDSGMTQKEAGEALGISRATVSSALIRSQYRIAMAAFGLKIQTGGSSRPNVNRDWLS
jgi:DNA-directed RNA polymerase specialized sigma24 family protein